MLDKTAIHIMLLESIIHKYELLSLSVLKQAFEEKITPQDPNDEPAS